MVEISFNVEEDENGVFSGLDLAREMIADAYHPNFAQNSGGSKSCHLLELRRTKVIQQPLQARSYFSRMGMEGIEMHLGQLLTIEDEMTG